MPVTPPPSLTDEKLPSVLGKRKPSESDDGPAPAKVQKTSEEVKKASKPKKADKGEPCKSSGEKEDKAIKEIKKAMNFKTREEFDAEVVDKLNAAVPKPKFKMENKDNKVTVVCTDCKKFKLRFTCETIIGSKVEIVHIRFAKAEGLHK